MDNATEIIESILDKLIDNCPSSNEENKKWWNGALTQAKSEIDDQTCFKCSEIKERLIEGGCPYQSTVNDCSFSCSCCADCYNECQGAI